MNVMFVLQQPWLSPLCRVSDYLFTTAGVIINIMNYKTGLAWGFSPVESVGVVHSGEF